MVKLTDIHSKMYARHLDGKTCACIYMGSELDAYFGVDNPFDITDRDAVEQFLTQHASDEDKRQCQEWVDVFTQVRGRFNLAEIDAQQLLEQRWLHVDSVKQLHHALTEHYQQLTAPRLFSSQAEAKTYLAERKQLSIDAVKQAPVPINQIVVYLVQQINEDAGDADMNITAVQNHNRRFQAWHQHCEQKYPGPTPKGMSDFDYLGQRNSDPTCQQLAHRIALSECYQEAMGSEFEPRMRQAAAQLQVLCKQHHWSFASAPKGDEHEPVFGLRFFDQPDWIETFVGHDGFDEFSEVNFADISISHLAKAGMAHFQAVIDENITDYLSHFTPLSHRNEAVVKVKSTLTNEDNAQVFLDQPAPFPQHLIPLLYVPMFHDASQIKHMKAMQAIMDSLAELTGLPINETRLSALESELALAYKAYCSALNELSNTLCLTGLYDLCLPLGLVPERMLRTISMSEHSAIDVPRQDLNVCSEAWLLSFMNNQQHAKHTDAFNAIIAAQWRNLDVFDCVT